MSRLVGLVETMELCPTERSVSCCDSQSLQTWWKPWYFYVCLFSVLPLFSVSYLVFLLYQPGGWTNLEVRRGVGSSCLPSPLVTQGKPGRGWDVIFKAKRFCVGCWIQVSYPTSLTPSCSSKQPCTCFVAITLHLRAANNGCLLPAGLILIFRQATLLKERNFWNDYGL